MNRIILHLAIFSLFSIPYFSDGQVTQKWVAKYKGIGTLDDEAKAIVTDDSGYIYVTGNTTKSVALDFLTIKYNPAGIEMWAKTFDGPAHSGDEARAIAVDKSGNVYVAGYITSKGANNDYATIKYNRYGDTLWVRTYDGPAKSTDGVTALTIDNSGNVYVTGYSTGVGTSQDFATIKYNSKGDLLWAKRYCGISCVSFTDGGSAIAVNEKGEVFVTGSSGNAITIIDFATIKYDSTGAQKWVSRLNGSLNSYDEAKGIALDKAGNIYVTGYSSEKGSGSDYLTVRYNSNGDSVWVKRYEKCSDKASSIVLDTFGNVYVTGTSSDRDTFSSACFSPAYVTIKYSNSGTSQWVNRYNGSKKNDAATAIVVDHSGNAYVTGISGDTSSSNDLATIKYTSSGNESWVKRYNGTSKGIDGANAITTDNFGNVYVAGFANETGTGKDFVTIRYSQSSGSGIITGSYNSSGFQLLQNYPNPFNAATTITYDIPNAGLVTLEVYDLTGNKIVTLVNEKQAMGHHGISFDGKNLQGGIYYYIISTSGFTSTQKCILIK